MQIKLPSALSFVLLPYQLWFFATLASSKVIPQSQSTPTCITPNHPPGLRLRSFCWPSGLSGLPWLFVWGHDSCAARPVVTLGSGQGRSLLGYDLVVRLSFGLCAWDENSDEPCKLRNASSEVKLGVKLSSCCLKLRIRLRTKLRAQLRTRLRA